LGGRGYQIKSFASDDRRSAISLLSLMPGWDVLVCVRLSRRYEPFEVVEIDRPDLPVPTRVVTERLLMGEHVPPPQGLPARSSPKNSLNSTR
jgi:hypothetical protein